MAAAWVKTAKGKEEVERKAYGLFTSRQVLIMIDGRRDLAALQSILPPEAVPRTVDCPSLSPYDFRKP